MGGINRIQKRNKTISNDNMQKIHKKIIGSEASLIKHKILDLDNNENVISLVETMWNESIGKYYDEHNVEETDDGETCYDVIHDDDDDYEGKTKPFWYSMWQHQT